jgi:hypothetical protein
MQHQRRIQLALVFILIFGSLDAYGQSVINVERLADAIYIAEGGSRTKHPYGILQKYKHTTPRQACINTIKSNMRRYHAQGAHGDFITYMARTYCPVGAANDPTGLNKNWVRNVTYYYNKGR